MRADLRPPRWHRALRIVALAVGLCGLAALGYAAIWLNQIVHLPDSATPFETAGSPWKERRELLLAAGPFTLLLYSDGPIPLLVAGAPAVAIGLGTALRGERTRRRQARALRGARLDATVTSLRSGVAGRGPWTLTARYEDPHTGAVEEFRYNYAGPPSPRPSAGEPVTVFVDLKDSSNYVLVPPV